MNNYTVYMHITPSEKKYIGITCQSVFDRWKNGKGYYYTKSYFQNAIEKHGWENIKHEILFENLTKEEAEQKEIELISFYKSNNPKFGYNISKGGNHAGKHNERTIEKMRKANLGEKASDETKKKLSDRLKGKSLPDWITERSKIINSARKKGKPEPNFTKYNESRMRKVISYDKITKRFEIYNSISEAAKSKNTNTANICYAIIGKSGRKMAGGCEWKYDDDIIGKTHCFYKCKQCGEEFIGFIWKWIDIDEKGNQSEEIYSYHDCGDGYFGAGLAELQCLIEEA